VALKFIRLGDQAGRVEMRALELMRGIRHPHLLPMFGAWQQGDFLIIALELADCTLLDRLKGAQGEGLEGIPQTELLEYVREAAKGLDYLNDYHHPSAPGMVGIQHKDVKPQNLLLVGGCVKVADFGLAKLLEHTVTAASGGLTPAYAAPEFFSGQATRWSDQYCLAVTYCQLRGGRLPFGGNAMQVMAGHITQPPDLAMLPEAERPAVARALAKQPEQRWPSCREFAEALAASARAGGEGLAQTTTFPSALRTEPREKGARKSAGDSPLWPTRTAPGTPPPRRWRKLALFAVIALLALSLPAVLVWSSRGRTGTTAPPDQANPPASPGSLRLLPLEAVTLEAGERTAVAVRLERRNCPGPVELRLEGLPEGVTARPYRVPAGEDVGRLELTATDEVATLGCVVRVEAVVADARTASQFRLQVVGDRVKNKQASAALKSRASAHLSRKEYDQALEDYTEALRLAPRDAEAYVGRGLAYANKGDLGRAIADYDQGIALDPKYALAYHNRGDAYRLKGASGRAIADCTEAIRLDPKFAPAYGTRGAAHRQKGDLREAIADYDRAIELDPKYTWAYSNRGEAYRLKGASGRAIADCTEAIRLDPNYALAYGTRGAARRQKGELREAIADYDRAIALDPKYTWAYFNRGLAFYDQKEYDKAIKDYDRAIALDPTDASAYRNRALAHEQNGDAARARADREKASSLGR
jgi:tetratricopeptide (TPR) repeat protein/serine/threonine protein kinase